MSKITKKVKSVFVTQKGDGFLYGLVSTDEEIYSTFDATIGKHVESLNSGDIVEIEFITNKKGYKNFTSIKPIEDDQEFQQKEEKREDKKGSDIHRQCAGKIAAMAGGWFDLKGLTEEARAEKFVELWKTVEDRLNEL